MPPKLPPRHQNREITALTLRKRDGTRERSLGPDLQQICPACKLPAAGEKGGLVISCGLSFFHIDCYTCKKCEQKLAVNDKVFVDLDGRPHCIECQQQCAVCALPISKKIVYVGMDTHYHPECFKCKKCSKVLDEDKFVKSTTSIYCISCHERRLKKYEKRQRRVQRENQVHTPTETLHPS